MAVRLSIPAAMTTVEPGTASAVEVRVGNTGATDATYRLEIQGEAAEWAMILPPELPVAAGDEAVARLVFHVPRAGGPPAGVSGYRVTATSTTDPDDHAGEEGFLAVGTFADTGAQLVFVKKEGRTSEYSFRLTNRGNATIRAGVTAVADDAGTAIETAPAVLVVEPGATETTTVRVTPPRRLRPGPEPQEFRVTARPEGGPTSSVRSLVESSAGASPWLARIALAIALPLVAGVVTGRYQLWSPDRSPREVVAEAAPNAARAETSRFSVHFEVADIVGPTATPGNPDYRLDGVFDFRRNEGRFTLDVSGWGPPVAAEVIRSPDGLYVRVPGTGPSTRPWLLVSVEDLRADTWLGGLDEATSGAVLAAVVGIGSMMEMLRGDLEELAQDVTATGKETLRGTRTDRYRLTLDTGVLEGAVAPDTGGTLDAGTAEVWVDDKGRARQIRMSLDATVTDPAEGGRGTGTYTMEFFDFGVAVDVDEPPADQVVSVAELAGMPPG